MTPSYNSDPELTTAEWFRRHRGELAEPGPDVNVPVSSSGLANRPPDAALSPVDVAQLDRIQELVDERAAALDQRDALLSQLRNLETQLHTVDRCMERAANYWLAKWTASRRTIKLLILIGGGVLAVETLAIAGLIWRIR